MFAEISAAIQSARALSDLIKGAESLGNYNELAAAVAEVNARLMDATAVALAGQEAQSKLYARIAELEAELKELAGWESQALRYALQSLAPGMFAYALRPERAEGEPQHLLCANCFAKRHKAFLQLRNQNEFGRWYVCHSCRTELHVDSGNGPPVHEGHDPYSRV